MGDAPDLPPQAADPFDPALCAEAALSLALQSRAHAAGLAMQAGPHAQACSRQLAAATVTMSCRALLDLEFKPSSPSQPT